MMVDMTTRTEDATADAGGAANSARSAATRDRILAVAEQLFAEHGVFAVSNRQVSEAAGQGNNAAVGYHFGTKTDLVRAIVNKHSRQVEKKRGELLREIEGSEDVRDWISCLVRASTDHYAEMGGPTWYARFSAQILTDPVLRKIVYDEVLASPTLQETLRGLSACLTDMPMSVRRARADIGRNAIVHMFAERERALAESGPGEVTSWEDFTTDLVDALVGLWTAPITR
jgi:AcrR family transcriptional regulator